MDDFINVSVWEMKAIDDQVVIATHGRGIWTVTLDGMTWPTDLVTSVPDPALNNELSVSNYPNPVLESTTIKYILPAATPVQLDVLTTTGRVVASYDLGIQPPGLTEYSWTRDPLSLSAGVYLIKVNTPSGSSISKMLLE
jgi:hypothetical protein